MALISALPSALVHARLFHVQDLAAQRQDRLEMAVAAGFRAAACGVALHQEDLTLAGIALRAVRQLAGQRRRFERRLAAGQVARLARRFARTRRPPGTCPAPRAPLRDSLQNRSPAFRQTRPSTSGRTSELPSFVLVCPSNCGSTSFTDTMAARPSRTSSPERF